LPFKNEYDIARKNSANGKKFTFAFLKARGVSWIISYLSDYIHPDDLRTVLDGYEKTMLSRDEGTSFDVRLVRPDQGLLWVHIRSVPVIWGDEPANLAFMRDITARKRMEHDLQQAQRMEAIGVLSGGIAHDFNNILTTIIGNAEMGLMDLTDGGPGKKEFEQIRESGYRARDLVRQVLTISREYTSKVQPLYLSPIIKEALKFLRSSLPMNIRIMEKIDRQLSLVKADSVLIHQVFMNLCTNAKHAMENQESACLEVELKNVVISSSMMTADSGKQALEKFAREPDFFDLLITDLAMPEMTGIKLAKEVLRLRPGFPVIMCTGHSDTFDENAAKEAGIMEYIEKPYNLKELGAIAAKYMKQTRAA
jgi:CheY-like chemotaxis protein